MCNLMGHDAFEEGHEVEFWDHKKGQLNIGIRREDKLGKTALNVRLQTKQSAPIADGTGEHGAKVIRH